MIEKVEENSNLATSSKNDKYSKYIPLDE